MSARPTSGSEAERSKPLNKCLPAKLLDKWTLWIRRHHHSAPAGSTERDRSTSVLNFNAVVTCGGNQSAQPSRDRGVAHLYHLRVQFADPGPANI
jgi:hypothetical protein